MNKLLLFVLLFTVTVLQARTPDKIYHDNIRSVKLYKANNQLAYPILTLQGSDKLELHFDDMHGDVKNYFYSFVLCDADWTVANVVPFDYIQGFQTTRISTYRISYISETKYTHYTATLPERSSVPTRSGNYILKVFLNNDTSKLAFTKRFLVVDTKVQLAAQIKQPLNGQLFQTHQRIQAVINSANSKVNILSPQDIKLNVVQNFNWTQSVLQTRPTIFRGNYFEYSDDGLTFPAGREFRWAYLNTFRLLTDRMAKIDDKVDGQIQVYLKPDADQSKQVYFSFNDINGLYRLENEDGNNPFWQSDYGYVHFTYVPSNRLAIPGKDVYIWGELTQYQANEQNKMEFNEAEGVYQKTLFLKQGYYNYSYVTQTAAQAKTGTNTTENLEGNFWAAENTYMVLVYFRPFGARSDELIGFTTVNSIAGR
jgi:hypothetical protein